MQNLDELAFFNAVILGKNRILIDLLTEAMAELNPYSSLQKFDKVESLKKQLDTIRPHLLIINLPGTAMPVKEFIVYFKKKRPEVKILLVDSSADIMIVRDFFKIGVWGFVSAEITVYELKIALQKIFSGEKYVGMKVSGKLISSFFSFKKRV